MTTDFELTALSPLDGRYRKNIVPLTLYFSEFALIKYRLSVEISYLLFLSQLKIIPSFTTTQVKQLQSLITAFDQKEATEIKNIENKTRHDVKAVEYYIQEKMRALKIPNREFIHFALTSEDTNSLAQGLMLQDVLHKVLLPELNQLITYITHLAKTHRDVVMLARTHGQPAIPTTLGKEFVVYAVRLHNECKHLEELPVEGKLMGAVGTLAAHEVGFPDVDWLKLSQEFIKSLGLIPNIITTQIVPADSYIRIFQSLQLINTILIGFTQDVWRYISDGYFGQKIKRNEVGSSTMPQKVNPIDFENAEGNLGMANALFKHFIDKLPVSRLQRDLSDSTVKRNIGISFGYSYLAYQNCQKGLQKITVNEVHLKQELLNHWEVVTEGLQTVLRTTGDEKAYEKLKEFGRGKQLTKKEIKKFVQTVDVGKKVKEKLLKITPLTYTGLAKEIVDEGIRQINNST